MEVDVLILAAEILLHSAPIVLNAISYKVFAASKVKAEACEATRMRAAHKPANSQ